MKSSHVIVMTVEIQTQDKIFGLIILICYHITIYSITIEKNCINNNF